MLDIEELVRVWNSLLKNQDSHAKIFPLRNEAGWVVHFADRVDAGKFSSALFYAFDIRDGDVSRVDLTKSVYTFGEVTNERYGIKWTQLDVIKLVSYNTIDTFKAKIEGWYAGDLVAEPAAPIKSSAAASPNEEELVRETTVAAATKAESEKEEQTIEDWVAEFTTQIKALESELIKDQVQRNFIEELVDRRKVLNAQKQTELEAYETQRKAAYSAYDGDLDNDGKAKERYEKKIEAIKSREGTYIKVVQAEIDEVARKLGGQGIDLDALKLLLDSQKLLISKKTDKINALEEQKKLLLQVELKRKALDEEFAQASLVIQRDIEALEKNNAAALRIQNTVRQCRSKHEVANKREQKKESEARAEINQQQDSEWDELREAIELQIAIEESLKDDAATSLQAVPAATVVDVNVQSTGSSEPEANKPVAASSRWPTKRVTETLMEDCDQKRLGTGRWAPNQRRPQVERGAALTNNNGPTAADNAATQEVRQILAARHQEFKRSNDAGGGENARPHFTTATNGLSAT